MAKNKGKKEENVKRNLARRDSNKPWTHKYQNRLWKVIKLNRLYVHGEISDV